MGVEKRIWSEMGKDRERCRDQRDKARAQKRLQNWCKEQNRLRWSEIK